MELSLFFSLPFFGKIPPPFGSIMVSSKDGCVMVIYADILLAVNWWIDFLLLLGVRRATDGVARGWRLALAALAGALTCFILFLPPMPVWASLLFKLSGAAVMVVTAFSFGDWRQFLRRLLLLFGLSAGLAGLCGALYFFVAPAGFFVCNGVVYYSVPPLLLVGLTVVCYGILSLMDRWTRRRTPGGRAYTVTVQYEDRTVRLHCLYDSGNHLSEPFSGCPVLVAERASIAQWLPGPAGVEKLPVGSAAGWRLIPYDSVGGSGLLPAFIPKQVTVATKDGEHPLPRCYVAVCDRLGRGEYQGLIGSALGDYLT